MAGKDFLDEGLRIIKEAIDADKKGDKEEAVKKYNTGITYLLSVCKYEKNPKIKETLFKKCDEYMDRLEYFKKELKNEANNGGKKNGVKVDGSDEGNTKMEKAISEAIIIEKPNIKWDDVAGLESAKQMLKEAVIFPLRFPSLFDENRKPWKGILLYGPPGTGKSYLAKAVATEAGNSTFFSVSSSDLVSKYLGESEKLVRVLFESARKSSPSIIFIDEIDSLCGKRGDGENDSTRRIKTEFLVQMQGVGKQNNKVLVLGATNTPWQLDPAIRRRFERRIFVSLPTLQAREEMFRLMIGKTPNNLTKKDIRKLAEKTEGFSGSDLDSLNRDALYEPLRKIIKATHFKKSIDENNKEYYEPVSSSTPDALKMDPLEIPKDSIKSQKLRVIDFLRVLPNTKPSVSAEDVENYFKWTNDFGTEGN